MEQYFARVFTQAQMSQLPLACRRGGGACLGLHGDAVSASGALKWTVAGVPSHWGPGTFQQWLEKQGWTEFKHVTAPKHTKGKWTCVAKPAETGEGPFAYQVGEQVITITKWMRAKPVANERWHAHGSKWFTVDGKEQEEATEVMEVDRQEVPTTVPDSPTAATQNEPGNGKTASPSKSTPRKGLSLSPPRSPLPLPVLLRLSARSVMPRMVLEALPHGTSVGIGMVTAATGP